jgi:tetratricopeptide (TPR) repeat protein
MVPSAMKYNPAFLDDASLIESFVARTAELEQVVRAVEENGAGSNQHLLIIGPRGLGKTTLVLRATAQIRAEPALRAAWHPIVFGEETYQASTPGEFWLEALFHLGEQTGDPKWRNAYEELRQEPDEGRLRLRVLAQLMDFADQEEKRLVLVVENLNMLIGGQISGDDAWVLRHTLMNEPRIMLLGTATSRFKEVEEYNQALYELFRIIELQPLDEGEARALWTATTGQTITNQQIRPLQILTGGNPRLIRILSEFAATTSFRSLMDDLTRLVDEHTDYFKHHLEALPPQERKVFVALADLWDPSTARRVAEAARVDVNMASALLKRLVERGAVVAAYKRGRAQYYQVAERMYNVYHLMRRRGQASSRVHAVVRFMVSLYRDEELVRTTKSLVDEASLLTQDQRREHFLAYEAILNQAREPHLARKLIAATRSAFTAMPDVPTSVLRLMSQTNSPTVTSDPQATVHRAAILALHADDVEDVDKLLQLASILSEDNERLGEAEYAFQKALERAPENVSAWHQFGVFLWKRMQLSSRALDSFDSALRINPDNSRVWTDRGGLLGAIGRVEEALTSANRAIELDEENATAWSLRGLALAELGHVDGMREAFDRALALIDDALLWQIRGTALLHCQLFEEAVASFNQVLVLGSNRPEVWVGRGNSLHNLQRYSEAVESYDRALTLDENYSAAWVDRGDALSALGHYQDALQSYDRALVLDEKHAAAWLRRGDALELLGRKAEALESFGHAVALDQTYTAAWAKQGRMLGILGRYVEALESFDHALVTDQDNSRVWFFKGLALFGLLRNEEALESYNHALEGETDDANIWLWKGAALRELGRLDESLESIERALALDSNNVFAMIERGLLLSLLSRDQEALGYFDRALAIQPDDAETHFQRGRVYQRLTRFEEAEAAFRQAIVHGSANGVSALVNLLLTDLQRPEEAWKIAKENLVKLQESPDTLNSVAWMFFSRGRKEDLAEAESWARIAVEKARSKGDSGHTLACLLGAQGKWGEALDNARTFLADTSWVVTALEEVVDFLIDAVAAGHGKEVLQLISESGSAETLEPLVVALRRMDGKDVDVAREILEVANDVQRKIEARQAIVQS